MTLTTGSRPPVLPGESPDTVACRLPVVGACVRCDGPVVGPLRSPVLAGTTVVCDRCVLALCPMSTWEGHRSTGTWWIDTVLEHDWHGPHDVVLLAHYGELVSYRRDGDRLVRVNTVA